MTYKTQQSYDPGTWGRYNSNLKDKVMPGFQPEPPAVDDICGEYEIIFAASFTPTSDDDHDTAQGPKSLQWHFRQKASGSLLIFRHPDPGAFELRGSFGIKVLFTGRLGSVYRNFRYGYNALGFVRGIYGYFLNRCSNALPLRIMGYNWGTRGHLYVVSERKAFPLIHPEEIGTCSWMDEDEDKDNGDSGGVGSSTAAAGKNTCAYAQLIYNTRHYSFLCRELGLSCVLATLITQYIGNDVVPKPDDYPPYLYAEPGDIWMDSKLSSQDSRTRTYLLARRKYKGDDDDDNNINVNQTNCCIQSRIVANMSPELLKIYWIIPPKMLSPIVNWMLCHPGKVPPRALTGLLTRLFRPHQNPNERRNHGGNSNNNIAAWNEEEGVVTRSRARRDREERERVLRPRLKRICYRT